jgi:hypothetical protein
MEIVVSSLKKSVVLTLCVGALSFASFKVLIAIGEAANAGKVNLSEWLAVTLSLWIILMIAALEITLVKLVISILDACSGSLSEVAVIKPSGKQPSDQESSL